MTRLEPVSVAERSLGAGARQWAGLAAVAVAAVLADQVTKQIVTSTLALDDVLSLPERQRRSRLIC